MADVIEVTQEARDSMLLELADVRRVLTHGFDRKNAAIKNANDHFNNEYRYELSREAELVDEVLRVFFPDEELEGVQKQDLGNGWLLKATFKKTTKIDDSKVEGVVAELQNMPSVNAEDIFPQVRKFVKRGYKDLHDSVKLIADKDLIFTPGNHTVDIIAPKRLRDEA